MWGLSLTLSIIITIIVPVDIVWPLGLVYDRVKVTPFFLVCRLTTIISILITNVFLLYKVVISNRKAKKNNMLGNEEEAKRFQKLVQLLCAQVKPTTSLLLVGSVDVIGNILNSVIFIMIIRVSVAEPNLALYLQHFLFYPTNTALLIFHPLEYALYMKKIRGRLPAVQVVKDCGIAVTAKLSLYVNNTEQH